VSSTALLFFFRVRALYGKNKYITAAFIIMWLGIVGGSLTVVTAINGVHIGNTKYCMFSGFKLYSSSANISIAIFDTCVFIAVSWRLLANSPVAVPKDGSAPNVFYLLGRYLPQFSSVFFQDGQNYYMYASYILSLVEEFLIFKYRLELP
jgi:hypothetical protein